MQKPNLLKHNSDMTEWAQELKDQGEFPTDEVLGHLVSLRQIDDEVEQMGVEEAHCSTWMIA